MIIHTYKSFRRTVIIRRIKSQVLTLLKSGLMSNDGLELKSGLMSDNGLELVLQFPSGHEIGLPELSDL